MEQARFRMVQPLKRHPALESEMLLDVRLAALCRAHVTVCRAARARVSSDEHFIRRFPVKQQLLFFRKTRKHQVTILPLKLKSTAALACQLKTHPGVLRRELCRTHSMST